MILWKCYQYNLRSWQKNNQIWAAWGIRFSGNLKARQGINIQTALGKQCPLKMKADSLNIAQKEM